MNRIPEEEENKIVELYINGKLSSVEIGKMLNRGHATIQRVLRRKNIPLRNLSESQFVKKNKVPDARLFDYAWLQEQHHQLNRSCKDIGKELGVDAGSVRRHMQQLGIDPKTNAESKIGLMTGENHPNWKGGITSLKCLLREYFNINLAPIAAKRDEYTCQLCGATHTILHIHHIIGFMDIVYEILDEHPDLKPNDVNDKQVLYDIITNDDRFTNIDNLITYCKECHYYKIHKYQHKKTISSQASTEEGSETIQ